MITRHTGESISKTKTKKNDFHRGDRWPDRSRQRGCYCRRLDA
jgi:hypothetical protein